MTTGSTRIAQPGTAPAPRPGVRRLAPYIGGGRRAERFPRLRTSGESVLAGMAVALLVLLLGSAFALTRPSRWAAESSLLVLPRTTLAPDLVAGYYDTLSRGQIVNTYAQLLRLPSVEASAVRDAGVTGSAASAIDITVTPVPDAAVIEVSVTAGAGAQAERVVDRAVAAGTAYISGLRGPYVMSSVSSAAGTARRTGIGTSTILALVGLVALAAGLAVQQALQFVHRRPEAVSTTGGEPLGQSGDR